jgi:F0F1-type ATP synthase assembly protein I
MKPGNCYNFADWQGACIGLASFHLQGFPVMLNSVAAGRSLALRAVVCQLAVVLLLALAFLVRGWQSAVAVAVGGVGVVLGNAVAAQIALGTGVVSARTAFVRLLLSMLLKWLAAVSVFVIALAVWRLPPLPMLAGIVAALLAYPLCFNFLRQGKT